MRKYLSIAFLAAVGCGASDVPAPPASSTSQTEVVTPTFNVSKLPTVSFAVPDMHCEACAGKVRETLASLPGVKEAQCDLEGKVVTVAVEKEGFDQTKALEALSAASFPGELKQ